VSQEPAVLLPLNHLWEQLPPTSRNQALLALGRLVAQRLPDLRLLRKEAKDEHN